MNSLERRLIKIEKKLGGSQGPWLRLPMGDGEFIEVPGCRTLADYYAKYVLPRNRNDNETQQDPTE